MTTMRGTLFLLLGLQLCFSWKLTDDENIRRMGECGRWPSGQTEDHSPWHVTIHNNLTGFNTGGSLISERHVLSASDAILAFAKRNASNDADFEMGMGMGNQMVNQCQDRQMSMPYSLTQLFSVNGQRVVKAWFLGDCATFYGMALLEVEEGFAGKVPICTADEVTSVDVGETLQAYSGTKGLSVNARWWGHGQTKVAECPEESKPELSICAESGFLDSRDVGGALATLTENEQETVVGVIWSFGNGQEGVRKHVSVRSFTERICDLSGVCLLIDVPTPNGSENPVGTTNYPQETFETEEPTDYTDVTDYPGRTDTPVYPTDGTDGTDYTDVTDHPEKTEGPYTYETEGTYTYGTEGPVYPTEGPGGTDYSESTYHPERTEGPYTYETEVPVDYTDATDYPEKTEGPYTYETEGPVYPTEETEGPYTYGTEGPVYPPVGTDGIDYPESTYYPEATTNYPEETYPTEGPVYPTEETERPYTYETEGPTGQPGGPNGIPVWPTFGTDESVEPSTTEDSYTYETEGPTNPQETYPTEEPTSEDPYTTSNPEETYPTEEPSTEEYTYGTEDPVEPSTTEDSYTYGTEEPSTNGPWGTKGPWNDGTTTTFNPEETYPTEEPSTEEYTYGTEGPVEPASTSENPYTYGTDEPETEGPVWTEETDYTDGSEPETTPEGTDYYTDSTDYPEDTTTDGDVIESSEETENPVEPTNEIYPTEEPSTEEPVWTEETDYTDGTEPETTPEGTDYYTDATEVTDYPEPTTTNEDIIESSEETEEPVATTDGSQEVTTPEEIEIPSWITTGLNKLSWEENKKRFIKCGKWSMQEFNHAESERNHLPAIAKVAYDWNLSTIANGFYITNRHILTVGDVMFPAGDLGFLHDPEDPACYNGMIQAPRDVLSETQIDDKYKVVSGAYIGYCNMKDNKAYGMTLLEIEEAGVVDTPKRTPFCVPEHDIMENSDELILMSMASPFARHEPFRQNTTPVILHSTNCSPFGLCVTSNYNKEENWGGALAKLVGNREYAVGMVLKEDSILGNFKIDRFYKQICQLTGACAMTPDPDMPSTTQNPNRSQETIGPVNPVIEVSSEGPQETEETTTELSTEPPTTPQYSTKSPTTQRPLITTQDSDSELLSIGATIQKLCQQWKDFLARKFFPVEEEN